jgi:DNA polymerase phi
MPEKRTRDDSGDAGGQKRRRQYSEQDQKLARIYNELADERNDVRIKAAKDFVIEFAADKNPDGESLEKAFTRLIRGLCSGRKAARFGFFIALSELLRQSYAGGVPLNGLGDVGKLLEQINILTKPEGDVPGQVSPHNYFYNYARGAKRLKKRGIFALSKSGSKPCSRNLRT